MTFIKNSVGLSTTPVKVRQHLPRRCHKEYQLPKPIPRSQNTRTESLYSNSKTMVSLGDTEHNQPVEASIRDNMAAKLVKLVVAHQLRSGDIRIFTSTVRCFYLNWRMLLILMKPCFTFEGNFQHSLSFVILYVFLCSSIPKQNAPMKHNASGITCWDIQTLRVYL